MATQTATVDEYVAAQPKAAQGLLRRVRATIRKTVPSAEEMIRYNIPTYKLNGRPLLHFAVWAQHFGLYPAGSKAVVAAFKKELGAYDVSRGTIRFPLDEPLPLKLIERIAKFRAKEIAAKAKPKKR